MKFSISSADWTKLWRQCRKTIDGVSRNLISQEKKSKEKAKEKTKEQQSQQDTSGQSS